MPDTTRDREALRSELEAVFDRATMPSSPAVATQILELIDDPNSTADQFAGVIGADPALAARLLELANSVHFGQRAAVTTIARAVTVIGLRQLRVVALGFELVQHLGALSGSEYDLQAFWQHSVFRACVARVVAQDVVPSYAEEAFLVGLLHDCGVLLLVQALEAEYGALNAENLSPTAFFDAECDRFPYTHVDAIDVMCAIWRLPETISQPLSCHHTPVSLDRESLDLDRLAAVSYFVGCIGFTEDAVTAAAEPALMQYAENELGLAADRVEAMLEESGAAYRDVASMFQGAIPDDLDVSALMLQANRQLKREACESEALRRDVEEEHRQMLDQQKTLRTALGQYREQASRDPLTGLLNRRALHNAATDCVGRASDCGASLAVLFLDLDNFKQINDVYGHPAGDEILKAVSGCVRDAVNNGGCAGRFGGEEFVAVIPGLSTVEARARSEQLVEEVRGTVVCRDGLELGITASVGTVWSECPSLVSVDELIAAADELMYVAKRGGKDRSCFRALPSTGPATTVDVEVSAGGLAAAHIDPDSEVSEEVFLAIAESVDHARPDWFAEDRKLVREDIFERSTLNYFVDSSMRLQETTVYVRNVAAGGVGLLTARRLIRGDLVEVHLELEGGPQYLAGLVAFCRHVDGPVFEVGVQLFQRSDEPILSGGSGTVGRELEWINELLNRLPDGAGDVRRSA